MVTSPPMAGCIHTLTYICWGAYIRMLGCIYPGFSGRSHPLGRLALATQNRRWRTLSQLGEQFGTLMPYGLAPIWLFSSGRRSVENRTLARTLSSDRA